MVENLSTTQIAKILRVSSTVPQRILKKYGLTRNYIKSQEIFHAANKGLTYDEYILSLPVFKKYRRNVSRETNKQKIELLENHDKRGKCGIEGAYQLDHKFSILEGFKQGIEPEILGSIHNLEFIPWEENISKGSKCSITIEELISLIESDILVRVK